MPFDSKQAVQLMEQMNYLVARLEGMPQLVPIAREIFTPLFDSNGSGPVRRNKRAPVRAQKILGNRTGRRITAARRKALSIAAKKRWAAAKRAGKNTIGGAG